jgi:hypothetical protein
MNSQTSRNLSYGAGDTGYGRGRSHVRSSFCIMPHAPRPERNTSFIYGRSDSRIRPLLNQAERNRMHFWAMLIALTSSAAGTTLLLAAFLR